MKIVLFSDVHITRSSVDRTALALRFLTDCCDDADMVVVLGDLFDFYHGYDGYIYPWYRSVTDGLKKLVERGKQVYFLEGNHEFLMGDYYEKYTGIACRQDLALECEGKKVYIAHGDGFARLSLARVLKHAFFYRVMDMLGPSLTWTIASLSRSFLSRSRKSYSEAVRTIFRDYSRQKFSEGYDIVILAHSHIPDSFEVREAGSVKQYFNTGDLARYGSYVTYDTASGFSLKKWGSTEKE
jgi:UDP-2,3-diacylglucosamine hydrolase